MKRLGIFSLLLLLSGSISAAEAVGRVILSFGQNYAVNVQGEKRDLKRKSEVFANDLLVTSSKGRLQVKFSDDSRLSLKPKTEFRIAEYHFDDANPDEGKAIYKLLKGGMRTISGKIGKVNEDNYRVETVVATIGIRGTHYGTEYTQQGLYTETVEGTVAVKTDQGTVLVNAGEAVSINAQTGAMRKGKATGQTAQGESEEEGSEEEAASEEKSSDDSAEEGSEEANEESASEETASEEGSSDGVSSEEPSDQEPTNSDETSISETDSTSSSDTTSGTETSDDTVTVTMDASVSTTGNSTTTETTTTTTDPGLTASQPTTSAPNPTGNGTDAPNGSFSLVAFIDKDPTHGVNGGSGTVVVDGNSSMTIDSSSGQDRVTGILYVDSGTTSTDPCEPCTFTGPSDQTLIRDAGTETLSDGTKISWGRWNQGSYTLDENGTEQDTLSDFHYLYAGSTTPESVIKAKTGSYIYKFSIGNPITIPQFEDGKTGELVPYDSTIPRTGRLAGGTYMKVDWGQQKVVEMNIHLQSKVHGGVDDYILTEEIVGGAYQDVILSDVLNGGEMKLQGTCSGSGRCINTVNLDGRMNMELVGSDAEAAAISYGASGSTTGSSTTNDISVVGTTVLK